MCPLFDRSGYRGAGIDVACLHHLLEADGVGRESSGIDLVAGEQARQRGYVDPESFGDSVIVQARTLQRRHRMAICDLWPCL